MYQELIFCKILYTKNAYFQCAHSSITHDPTSNFCKCPCLLWTDFVFSFGLLIFNTVCFHHISFTTIHKPVINNHSPPPKKNNKIKKLKCICKWKVYFWRFIFWISLILWTKIVLQNIVRNKKKQNSQTLWIEGITLKPKTYI